MVGRRGNFGVTVGIDEVAGLPSITVSPRHLPLAGDMADGRKSGSFVFQIHPVTPDVFRGPLCGGEQGLSLLPFPCGVVDPGTSPG